MKYKQSFYTIITDKLDDDPADEREALRLLYASRTSNLIAIREKHYRLMQEQAFYDLPPALLEELIKVKAIVEEDEDELATVINENKEAIANSTHLHYVVMPTSYCQLGCDYCGQEHTKANMNAGIMDGLVDRLETLLRTEKFKTMDIAWFGAEPLVGISQIRKLAPRFMALAEKYNCTYFSKIVTNGLALKEEIYEEIVTKYKVGSVEITLDGIAEFHDQRRHTKSHDKTFDIIFRNVLKIVNRETYPQEARINIRCNADERNVDGIVPLIELLAEHRLQDKINFYIAPVYSWGNDAHLRTPINDFAMHEIDWYLALKKNGFPIHPLPGRVHTVCTSVMPNDEVIDSAGRLYNCTEVPLVPVYDNGKYMIGHVTDEIEEKRLETKPFLDWNDRILNHDKKLWCWSCKIFPVCGGRCPKNWMENIPPCPVMKFNMEDRMALMYYLCKESVKEIGEESHENNEQLTI